jgi:hypothetical protein
MATKATKEAEVLEIGNVALLKRRRGCLEDVRCLEEALQLQNKIFRGTFNIGAGALRQHKDATAALASAQRRDESPTVIKALLGVEENSEADLK